MPRITSAEFRRAAVARIRDSGLSIRDIADEVGVSYESLRSWRKQEQTDIDEALTGSERAGVRRLLLDAQLHAARLRLRRVGDAQRAARRDPEASRPPSREPGATEDSRRKRVR